MSKLRRLAAPFALLSLTIATACAPADLESAPITLVTAAGPVVCQLYTGDIVYWDRAIEIPREISPEQADDLCRAEGLRILHERMGNVEG